MTLFMAGTFVPKDPTLRSIILVGDRFLEEVDDRRGVANQILVKIRDVGAADAVSKAVDGLDFPVAIETKTQYAARDQATTDLDEMLRYATHVMIAVAVVIFVGLAQSCCLIRDSRSG